MKKLIPVLLFFLIALSCEKGETHWFCYDCRSMVYGKEVRDRPCYEDPTEIERYKLRLIDFYEGGMTTIDCVLLPDPDTIPKSR